MKNLFFTKCLLIAIICFTKLPVQGAIEKTITVTVGETFKISPWSDASSSFSGYSCLSTSCKAEDETAFSIKESTKTATKCPTPYQTTGYIDGFYCSYNVTALKPGKYIINGYAFSNKRDGVNLYKGTGNVKYHVTVENKKVVQTISIPENLVLTLGEPHTFYPIIYETGAETTLTWNSSDPTIASVTDGVVTTIQAGTTIISCTAANGVSASCKVTVKPVYVNSITFDYSEISILEGKRFVMGYSISPKNAANKDLDWTSSNDNIAVVTSEGIIIGVSSGYCYITAKAKDESGVSKSFLVIVSEPPYDAEIDGICYNLNEETKEAEVTYENEDYNPYYSGDIIIPETVTYKGFKYTVTSVGEYNQEIMGKTNVEIIPVIA